MGQKRSSPRRQERGEKPPASNRALSALLQICDVQVQELAEASGRQPGTLSDYARRKTLSLKNYWSLTGHLADRSTAEQLLHLVEAIDRAEEVLTTPAALATELGSLAERLAATIPQKVEVLAAQRERQRCQNIWTALRHLTIGEWRHLCEGLATLRCPAFVEFLAEESARAASDDADRSLALANLALWLAKKVPEDASRRQCEGFAWGFVGNARRVRSDLQAARKAFILSARLWQADSPGVSVFLPGWRLLDLEASLWIDLRKPGKALALLDQAAEAAPRGDAQARLLNKRSNALMLMGDLDGSIAALEQARSLLNLDTAPHLLWIVHCSLLEILSQIGRAAEAEPMLPELRALAARLGNGLDGLRLYWLEARIAGGVGRTAEAIEALSRVRADFAERKIRYDEALASMELAALYLELGRTADVKRLVLQMEPVFRDKGVHEEARKALDLFRRAVELETVSVELVRRIVSYLYRAQHDPELRFEEAGCRRGETSLRQPGR
jgi:tetratricopeptide (TPR) repeat protein